MHIGVLGTGTVGTTIGERLIELGHDVRLGSRSADNAKAVAWSRERGRRASHGTFADAAAFGSVLFNCTAGAVSMDALHAAGSGNLAGKTLVDVANALDSERRGSLLFCNTESLGERIQAAFPAARVVKTLNTMWCGIMVNPRRLPESHVVYVSGNDARAKSEVTALLRSFGWEESEIVDLGDISTARGPEMLLPLWLQLFGTFKTCAFNLKVVR